VPTIAVTVLAALFGAADQYLGSWPGHAWAVDASLLAAPWLVLPFAGLEVLLFGAAYVMYARRAADYERIELESGRLTVEVGEAQKTWRYEMDARWARVCVEEQRVVLLGAREQLELGRHLDADTRARFAAELQKRLRI